MDPLCNDTQPSAGEILLIDDQPIVRDGLSRAIDRLGYGVTVIEVDSMRDAVTHLSDHPELRLAVVDVTLDDAEGLRAVTRLLAAHPSLPVLVLSGRDDPATARGALEAGARGFISKRSPIAVLIEVIRLILVGGTYVPPHAVGAREPKRPTSPGLARIAPVQPKDEPPVQLTARQRDVLALMLKGRPNKSICRTLNLCEGTVKTHVANIFRILGVSNRTEAAYAVQRLRLELPEVDERMTRFGARTRLGLSLVA